MSRQDDRACAAAEIACDLTLVRRLRKIDRPAQDDHRGLKPALIFHAPYAALKGRTSAVIKAFFEFFRGFFRSDEPIGILRLRWFVALLRNEPSSLRMTGFESSGRNTRCFSLRSGAIPGEGRGCRVKTALRISAAYFC